MKSGFPLFMLLIGCMSMNNSQSYLSNGALRKYNGKEVSVFLNDLTEKFIEYYFLDEPPGKLGGCTLCFETYEINIYISSWNFVKRFNREMVWDFEDFKKEKIDRIRIIKY
ncbi:MAG: hypothetical protein LBJ31_05245 [Treponema sp.]|jgi:hypothetical protein|nr:hypothetical protein [Treponema sp.]